MEPGEDANQQLRAFSLVLFGHVLFRYAMLRFSAVFLLVLSDLDRVGEYA